MTRGTIERQFNINLSGWEPKGTVDCVNMGPYTIWCEKGNDYYISRDNVQIHWRVDLSEYVIERRN